MTDALFSFFLVFSLSLSLVSFFSLFPVCLLLLLFFAMPRVQIDTDVFYRHLRTLYEH